MNAETEPTSPRPSLEPRHGAREAAIQMLYQWEIGRASMEEVQQTYWAHAPEGAPLTDELRAFATTLAVGTAAHLDDWIRSSPTRQSIGGSSG